MATTKDKIHQITRIMRRATKQLELVEIGRFSLDLHIHGGPILANNACANLKRLSWDKTAWYSIEEIIGEDSDDNHNRAQFNISIFIP